MIAGCHNQGLQSLVWQLLVCVRVKYFFFHGVLNMLMLVMQQTSGFGLIRRTGHLFPGQGSWVGVGVGEIDANY